MATSKIPTMLRLPEQLHEKVKLLADIEHRSMNMEIEYALSKYVSDYESQNGTIPLSTPSESE